MPSIFRIVKLLAMQMIVASSALASTGVKCEFKSTAFLFGLHVTCDTMKDTWYANFEYALVDLYAAERHGVVHFDWEQIKSACHERHMRPDFCERL